MQLSNLTAEADKGILPEAAMCWTSNIRDMVNLANNLFWARTKWFTAGEKGDHGPSGYWGWNEVPLARTGSGGITNPDNWDAVVVKMPLYVCGGTGGDDHLGCLTTLAATNLETDISQWVKDGKLVPGADNVGKRPGAYVVLMREWRDGNGNSASYFFCSSWSSPAQHWEIVYEPQSKDNPTGACYLIKGAHFSDDVLNQTFPAQVSRSEAKSIVRANAGLRTSTQLAADFIVT